MPTASGPLAGPRRARPVSPPPPPTPRAPVTPPPVAPAAPASAPVRALPALDYDEAPRSTPADRAARLETTRPGTRRKSRRLLWFMLGIAFGAAAAVCARGDTVSTLRYARAWGASALRSLERSPPPAASVAPSSMATGTAWTDIAPKNAPCPMEPGPGDPCAELLAPFTASVPTVNIEDLPRVKPAPVAAVAPVVIVSRRARAAAAAPREAKEKEPADPESEETQAAPQGINPDAEDSQTAPARVVPTTPPAKPAEPRSSDMSSARAEAT